MASQGRMHTKEVMVIKDNKVVHIKVSPLPPAGGTIHLEGTIFCSF